MAFLSKLMRIALSPFACIYGAATGVRNLMFNAGILRSRRFPLPVICVGNITAGGTGKTPHVEYLAGLLQDKVQVAVVSRGYRRKSKGLVVAGNGSTADDIGDEPFQIRRKFPEVHLVADADRCEAVARLLQPDIKPPVEAVVLDDAFQHRYIAAGMRILLVDYSRPVFADWLLPCGMLRESFAGRRRANAVIVTKCPGDLSVERRNAFAGRMELLPGQRIFFTAMQYGTPERLFAKTPVTMRGIAATHPHIVALAGIARPEPFFDEIRKYAPHAQLMPFGDHHGFSRNDIRTLEKAIDGNPGTAILTTEKDGARLLGMGDMMSETLRQSICTLPIKVEFLFGEKEKFNDMIFDYVRQDKRNGGISCSAD